MRLYLAVAVLMLAFLAYTEAQEDPVDEVTLSTFRQTMAGMGRSMLEKVKTTFETVQNSEVSTSAMDAVNELIEKIKAQFNK